MFKYEGGVVSFVEYLNQNKNPILPKPLLIESEQQWEGESVFADICFSYNDSYSSQIISFVNNINTVEGGTHDQGFRQALLRSIVQYGAENKLFKADGKDQKIVQEDTHEGLTAIISIKFPGPQFESQKKIKLTNQHVRGVVDKIVFSHVSDFLEKNPQIAKKIIAKVYDAMQSRLAARNSEGTDPQEKRPGGKFAARKTGRLPREGSRQKRDSFCVEGDSAGGSAKMGRDRKFQAVLPLKGKILNVEKSRFDKMLGSEEIRTLITALGTGIREDFDIAKIRYHKIVVMTDADVDGSHILTLLLTFFYRQMPEIIERGYLFIACPPLYRIKKGKEETYIEDDRMLKSKIMEGIAKKMKFAGEVQGSVFELFTRTLSLQSQIETLCSNSRLSPIYRLFFRYAPSFETMDIHTMRAILADLAERFPEEEISCFLEENESVLRINHGDGILYLEREQIEAFDVYAYSRVRNELEKLGPWKPEGKFSLTDEKNERFDFDYVFDALDFVLAEGKKSVYVQRYKGLGEMNPEQLWETTMEPEKRVLLQVRTDDAVEADSTFNVLMGDHVQPRRDFILKNALKVKNLDI